MGRYRYQSRIRSKTREKRTAAGHQAMGSFFCFFCRDRVVRKDGHCPQCGHPEGWLPPARLDDYLARILGMKVGG